MIGPGKPVSISYSILILHMLVSYLHAEKWVTFIAYIFSLFGRSCASSVSFLVSKDYTAKRKRFNFLFASVAARYRSFGPLLPPRSPLFCLFLAQCCVFSGFSNILLCFMVPDACFLCAVL